MNNEKNSHADTAPQNMAQDQPLPILRRTETPYRMPGQTHRSRETDPLDRVMP